MAQPLPAGACDTHVHVFAPAAFPYAAQRTYTPGAATAAQLQGFHAGLGIERAVLVQPSVYGTDNACLLAAIERLGQERARGIAVEQADAWQADLVALHAGGIRGLRLNLEVDGQRDALAASHAISQVVRLAEGMGWSLHLHAGFALLRDLAPQLLRSPVPVVLDHFAGVRPGLDREDVSGWLRSGPVFVKLSAPYKPAPPQRWPELADLAAAWCHAAPERVLWGSDRPHTGGSGRANPFAVEPFRQVDTPGWLTLLQERVGPAAWKRLLVDNPARLFGFT
jgi:predicted TIM-barrel fold metal-dependent hydrolase